MNEDLLIRRYQHRPGYRLADTKEIALPVYALNVQVLTLAHKRLPPIEEFILRCLDMGFTDTDEISRFLGLGPAALRPSFASLAQTENIALTKTWALTQKGRTTLQASELIAPEERTFQIHFDAILRKPVLYRFQRLLRHREILEEGLIEIEAYPPKRPQLSEISPRDIERILKTVPGLTDQRRDVLVVRSIENVRKAFIHAMGLIFRALDGNELQLGFLVEGTLSREHELAFAPSQGFRRMMEGFDWKSEAAEEVADAKANVKMLSSVRSAAVELEASVIATGSQLATQAEAVATTENEDEKELLKRRVEDLECKLDTLNAEKKKLPVQDLYVSDHPPLLEDTLVNAQRRVLIISPWIAAKVVNRDFIRKLEDLLRKQVATYIGYGIDDEETEDLSTNDRAARDDLKRLAAKHQNLHLVRLGNTHAKVLIKDSDFYAVTSFNWLSFKGDPRRVFRDEQGVLIRDSTLVDSKFDQLVEQFRTDGGQS